MLAVVRFAQLVSTFVFLSRSAPRAPGGEADLTLTGSFAGSSAHDLATGEFHSVWTGQANHFGIADLEQHARIAVVGPSKLRFRGMWKLTAADGDHLFGAAAGTGVGGDPAHLTLTGRYVATGGTGRFAKAAAAFTVTVRHTRTALENGVSYGEQLATLEGQLRW